MTLVFLSISNEVIERALFKRRPGYGDYMGCTNAFFPRRPTAVADDTTR
jgi:steroid 5-alpha reductase family enzyme